MDILLLGITIVSLIVALVMSVTAWRVIRDEKRRSSARVAALSAAADAAPGPFQPDPFPPAAPRRDAPVRKAPWSSPPTPARVEPEPVAIAHATGFLGSADVVTEGSGQRQRSLAMAAVALFVVLSGGLVWMMSGSRATAAAASATTAPLELMSLSHQRQNDKLSISGLVRNPLAGKPVEHLSAVVFLFDRMGTFITSARTNVDFLKLGAGDESPFVVSLDAPASVARYRVSFRTDDGVLPHIDRRDTSAAPAEGEQPVSVTLK